MTIFVEQVLFENVVIDLFLLWLTQKALNQKPNLKNLLIASIFGAVFVLLSTNLQIFGFWAVLLKLLVAVFMCACLEFNFSHIFKKTLIFLSFTFCFGGMLLVLFSFLGQPISQNGTVAFYNSKWPIGALLVFCLMFFVLLKKLLQHFFKKQKVEKFCYDLKLEVGEKVLDLKGFLDTGNTLFDCEQKPIVILNKKQLSHNFKKDEIQQLLKTTKSMSIKSLAGEKTLKLLKPKNCWFEKKQVDIIVGICEDDFFQNKDFDVILNPKMLEAQNV